jgi:nucleoside-diphosphate-sugar epimerase
MRVLVTGGSGFVGRVLCEYLVARGYLVRATHRRGAPPLAATGVEWVHATDLNNPPLLQRILEGCGCVVHLAALAHQIGQSAHHVDYDRVNHLATAELARAVARCNSVRRLVFVSSIGAVCSASEQIVQEATRCLPENAYGRSKRAAEVAIESILANTQQDWCIIRPTLVYGPGNPGNMLRLVRLARLPLPLPFAAIRNRRSFIYVGNLVDLIERALTHPNARRKIFNVADKEVFSTPELIRLLGSLAGHSVRLLPAPAWSLRLLGRAGDLVAKLVGRSFGIDTYSVERLLGSLEVDTNYVREQLDWTPPWTAHEGFRLTMAPHATAAVAAKRLAFAQV